MPRRKMRGTAASSTRDDATGTAEVGDADGELASSGEAGAAAADAGADAAGGAPEAAAEVSIPLAAKAEFRAEYSQGARQNE